MKTVFVDYLLGPDNSDGRWVFAVQQAPDGGLQPVKATVAEQEGGDADIAAIGFANADRDPAKELIVIIKWEQQHYDYGGRFWEVRLFDDLKPGQKSLLPLSKISAHFGSGCECYNRDGSSKSYRYMNIASVRRELSRLGY